MTALQLQLAAGGLAGAGLALVLLKVPSFMTTLGVSAIGLGVATLMFAGVQPNITDAMLEFDSELHLEPSVSIEFA